jgi:hypothetical protein
MIVSSTSHRIFGYPRNLAKYLVKGKRDYKKRRKRNRFGNRKRKK